MADHRSILIFRWLPPLWAFTELFHLLANPADLVGLLIGEFSAVSVTAWLSAMAAATVLALPVVRPAAADPTIGATSTDRATSTGRADSDDRSVAWQVDRVGLRAFMVLCVLLVGDLVVSAPRVGNHQMILALGSLLLGVALGAAAFGRSGRPGLAATAMAVTGLRWLLLIAYGLIAFSKLNSDYLNPVVSCAVVFGNEMSEWFGLSVADSGVASRVAIYGSLLTELSVPVLLATRRFRSAGVVLGLAFHGFLSLEPVGHVYDFTAVLIPFFLLFAPLRVHRRMADTVSALQARVSTPLSIAAVVLVLLGNLIAIGVGGAVWLVGFVLWLVYLAGLMRVVVPLLLPAALTKRWRAAPLGDDLPTGDEQPMLTGHRLTVAVVAVLGLALMNGLAPYLQLKTATAFNMYSNLRVVGADSNHLIVPVGPQMRRPELYRVTTGDDDDPLSFYVDRGLVIPGENLRRYLEDPESGRGAGLEVTAVVGTPDSLSADDFVGLDAADRSAVGDRALSVAQTFGLWRAVDADGPAQCLRLWGPAY